ncbi:hypothetical protein [Xanthomonas sp. GPE 39]|uniref:hypothetical protein n=1 Tax=Xanthomonas sp. GPE 39 TaxID=1583099 RepID=UPI00126A736A|nr:hypothetical protein [Xanthomonas sp. GPE 39]
MEFSPATSDGGAAITPHHAGATVQSAAMRLCARTRTMCFSRLINLRAKQSNGSSVLFVRDKFKMFFLIVHCNAAKKFNQINATIILIKNTYPRVAQLLSDTRLKYRRYFLKIKFFAAKTSVNEKSRRADIAAHRRYLQQPSTSHADHARHADDDT